MFGTDVDWAVFVPATITAVTLSVTTILGVLVRRDVKEIKPVVQEMAPKVSAIDTAVNGQPPGAEHLVDKVAGIKDEQARVKEELVDRQRTHGGEV